MGLKLPTSYFQMTLFFWSVTLIRFFCESNEFEEVNLLQRKGSRIIGSFFFRFLEEQVVKLKRFFVATGFLQTASPSSRNQLMLFLLRSCKYIGGRGNRNHEKELTPWMINQGLL